MVAVIVYLSDGMSGNVYSPMALAATVTVVPEYFPTAVTLTWDVPPVTVPEMVDPVMSVAIDGSATVPTNVPPTVRSVPVYTLIS